MPDLSHHNHFEVSGPDEFLDRIFGLSSKYLGGDSEIIHKKISSIRYILSAHKLPRVFGPAYVMKDDYYVFDESFRLITEASETFNYANREKLFSINHNTMKYLMRNSIIKPLEHGEHGDALMAKLMLINKSK